MDIAKIVKDAKIPTGDSMTNFKNKSKKLFPKVTFMDSKDWKIVGILMLIFTLLVFFRLGNMSAPQSQYKTSPENRDIVLDFGDYILIEKLHAYLGNLDSRKVTISVYNEVTKEWIVTNPDANIGSVFQWNDVDVYYTTRYLGIVSTDDEAVYNEFVFTGPNGTILPVNANEYPELFDEQDLFYATTEKTYMDGTMFDEVYHGRTGYEFVHGLPTYETTHPQLGKCILALGIELFGMTPFGMRFFVALFGILFIPLMYIFAKKLFNDTFIATCVGFFITFDCMHYTLSRIATIDIFVAFFIILCYYFMYRYIEEDNIYRASKSSSTDKFPPSKVYINLALSGGAMGLAVATKLTGVYAGVGLAVILLYHTIKKWPKGQALKLFGFCMAYFIVLPLLLYTLAYIPVVEANALAGSDDDRIEFNDDGIYIGYAHDGLLAKTVRNTNYMINYHKNLEATHYYSSPFYEWPFVWMPLLAANDATDDLGDVSAVSYMGNVLIWWLSLPCILFVLYLAIVKKDSKARFLSVSYLAQYIPWMSVSRCTFIYHYLPSILFAMFMMGYSIKKLIEWKPNSKKYVKIYLGAVVFVFVIFFPVISGLPFPKEWGLHLRWLPDWILVL